MAQDLICSGSSYQNNTENNLLLDLEGLYLYLTAKEYIMGLDMRKKSLLNI